MLHNRVTIKLIYRALLLDYTNALCTVTTQTIKGLLKLNIDKKVIPKKIKILLGLKFFNLV